MKVSVTMNIRHFAQRALLVAAALFLMLPLALQAAKAVPVTVTGAYPGEAIQGEMKTIKITGTGFDNGSKASFLVSGTTDASQIVVTTIRFKSSTELEADIQVQPSALTVNYDVEVRTSTGRKGKGTTLFKVTLDPSVILPVNLGVPTGCSNSLGTGLNDGAYPAALVVTADTYSCTTGKDRPYRWQNGAWYNLGTLGATSGGITTGVSNDGAVVGWLTGSTGINTAFVVNGGIMTALPRLAGMVHSEAEGISQDGTHIFGNNAIEGEAVAVRWARDVGGNWNAELIGVNRPNVVPRALGSSDDGSILVGQDFYTSDYDDPSFWNKREGWVWMAGEPPEWKSLGLGSEATDISPRGELIVGVRYQDNGEGTNTTYQVPVYWTADDGFSTSHDLMGLDDGAGSKAEGVGMLQNGDLVIVGFAHTFVSSQIRIMRAVAWLPLSPGVYGPPIRLAAIGGSSTLDARAVDVNANGMVVGYSNATGGSRRAVLWMLPPTP